MRVLLVALLSVACSAPPSPVASEPAPIRRELDLIIRGGEVLDGTGAPRRRADVGVRGDTIVEIGDLAEKDATVVLDATGHVVTPGFIDLLGNSQAAVLLDPQLEGKIRQGVTTEVTGEGHSPAPQNDVMAAEMERTKPEGWPKVTWRTMREFMNVVEANGTALNFAFYVGAANAREMVIGHEDRAPDAKELRAMEAIVQQAVAEGAVGLSSALIYPPGRFARTEELIAMANVAGSYWTHLRSESSNIDVALDEAIRIGREAGVPVNVFHLKIGGRANWGRMPEILGKIEAAQKSGVDIAANIYPFMATSTELTSIVPAWALEGGYEAFRQRLRDPAMRARVARELGQGRLAGSGAETLVIRGNPSQRLDRLAADWNVSPAEAVLRRFESEPQPPMAVFLSLSEDDMKAALVKPWVAFGSDSGAVVDGLRRRGAHPRAYATFARVLSQYVREEKLLSLEEAVRKMTSLAASRAGLRDRGVLREGMKADIAVFDPARVRDRSTYEDPHHFSEGVKHVVVNGIPVLQDGAMTGKLGGRVLRGRAGLPSPPASGGRQNNSPGLQPGERGVHENPARPRRGTD